MVKPRKKAADTAAKEPGDTELAARILAILARNEHLENGGASSQQDLADAIGVSPSAVGKWIRSGKVARQNIVPLCNALKCSADELLGRVQIGSAPQGPLALEELAEALEFLAKYERMQKANLSYREKAQVLLNVMDPESMPS